MKATIAVIFLSLSLVHCSHAPKMADIEDGPESCKLKAQLIEGEKKEICKNPIMEAVFRGDVEKVKHLISSGENIQSKDSLGLSYLHLAAAVGNSEMIEVLVKAGLPVNAKMGKKGSTPAHSAVSWGKVASLQALLRLGADLDIRNADGMTPEALARDLKKKEVLGFFYSLKKM